MQTFINRLSNLFGVLQHQDQEIHPQAYPQPRQLPGTIW